MKRIDTDDMIWKLAKNSNMFENYMLDRFGNHEEIMLLCYLCRSEVYLQALVIEAVELLDLSIDCSKLDTEAGEDERRKLKTLKEIVYLCCEEGSSLLLKYINTHSQYNDSCELTDGDYYNVVKIDGDNYIIVDETGEDWTYPSSMFEQINSNGYADGHSFVRYRNAKKNILQKEYRDAVNEAAMAMAFSRDEEGGSIQKRYADTFIEAYNLYKEMIDKECYDG